MADKKRLIEYADGPEVAGQDGGSKATEQDKIAKLESLRLSAEFVRKQFEAEWLTNIGWLAGKQWETYESDVYNFTNRTVRVPNPSTKVQIAPNYIYQLTRNAAALGSQNMAQQVATAATSDQEDVLAAELGTDFLQGRTTEDDEEQLHFYEWLWMLATGLCIRKTYWDPEKDGYGFPGKKINGIGDIANDLLSPFHVYLCPWTPATDRDPWIIESDVRDIDEINSLYPGHDVKAEEVATQMGKLDRLLTNVVTGFGGPQKREHAAILYRLHHIPGRNYPKGRVWTWASQKLLDETDLPEGEMPYVKRMWFPIPGRIYPYSFITPLREIQKEINITLSQLLELKNRQLRGDTAQHGGSVPPYWVNGKDADGNVTDQKILMLDPGVVDWKFMQYELNPGEGEILLNRLWECLQRVSGLHESASLGEASKGAQTLGEIRLLKESDITGIALFRSQSDRSDSKIARLKLLLAKNHYEVPRMVRVVGQNNAVKTDFFYGSQLGDTEDVRPRPMPIISEMEKSMMKAELAAKGVWDLSGTPTMIANKVRGILDSGIPGVREDLEEQLPQGMSIEEVFKKAGEFTRLQIEGQIKLAAAQEQMVDAQIEAASPAGPGQGAPQGVLASMAA